MLIVDGRIANANNEKIDFWRDLKLLIDMIYHSIKQQPLLVRAEPNIFGAVGLVVHLSNLWFYITLSP